MSPNCMNKVLRETITIQARAAIGRGSRRGPTNMITKNNKMEVKTAFN